MGKAENSRSRMVHLSRGQLDVSTASPCKHLTLQNPRLTANEMTASQKCDLKQTHAREGAMKFCANHRGRDNLKSQGQASAHRLPKHSWNHPANDQCSNNRSRAQFHGIERLQFHAISSKDHHYRENLVMPSESLLLALLSRVTKCTQK